MIKIGSTRLVLLSDTKAIKIARIRPIGTIFKIISITLSRKSRNRFKVKYDKNISRGLVKYLFAGIDANRLEFSTWENWQSDKLAPVIGIYLYGLVVIQKRLQSISVIDLEYKHPFPELAKVEKIEMNTPCQYGADQNGIIYLLDYGSKLTTQAIRTILDQEIR